MNIEDTISNLLTGAIDTVFYGRFSSDHQRPSSIADQAEEACRFAERRALSVPGRMVKDEGVSVMDGMAPGFRGLLEDVHAERVNSIIVDELSRISRTTEDILRVQTICRFHGVSLWSVHENIDITDDNADIHVLFAGHKNQAASRDARHRVKRSMDGNLRRGLSNGDLTLGYKSVELTDEEVKQLGLTPRARDFRPYKRIVIDEDQAATVRLIFDLFVVQKKTIRAIAKHLNKHQVPRGGKARLKRWRPINVRKVLDNRRYLGYRWRNAQTFVTNPYSGKKTARPQSKSDLIEEFDESLRITDPGLFDAAQKRLLQNRKAYAKRRRNAAKRSAPLMEYAPRQLLAGTLECGECETKLVQHYSDSVPYYVCPTAQEGTCGNNVLVRRDLVHEVVLKAICDETSPMFIADYVIDLVKMELDARNAASTQKIPELQRKLQRVSAQIDNLVDAIATRSQSAALLEALDDRETEKRQVELEIRDFEGRATAPSSMPTAQWVQNLLDQGLEHLLDDNIIRAAQLIRQITGPIRVFPAQKTWLRRRFPIVCFNLDFSQMATAVAAGNGELSEPIAGGFGVSLELEIRKTPAYEQHASEIVRLRDELRLSWREVDRCLPKGLTPANARQAYKFGKTGDPYGNRAAAGGGTPPRLRRE